MIRSRRKKWLSLPILLLVGAGVCVLFCGGSVVGYLIFGVERTSDPAQVRATLDNMTDVQIAEGLQPDNKSVEITGVETVEFRSGSRASYLIISTGPRFRLSHSGTLRESSDRGRVAGGGNPESPTENRTIKATIRGQPAEFIYRRYGKNETVSGYFQGKQFPVHLQAQLSLSEFSPGTAATLVESIR
jgi:hypothetical protein